MSYKRLNSTDQDLLKELALNGTTPEDLAERFAVSISTIHNYKRQMRLEGLEIPDVRGKRPSGNFAPVPSSPAVPSAEATPALTTLYLRHQGVDFTIVVDARAQVYLEESGRVLITFA